MAEAKFPIFCANIRNPDGTLAAGLRERTIMTFDGIRIGIAAATDEEAVILSSPGDLKFPRAVETIEKQAAALRQEGADIVVACVHTGRAKDEEMYRMNVADIILSGHDHDLWVNYDGRSAAIESSYDAHFVTCIDVTFTVRTNDGRREVTWHPEFRIVDTRNVTPDAEVARRRQRIREEALEHARHRDRHHRGRTRQPQRHGAHAGGGDRQSDRGRDACRS